MKLALFSDVHGNRFALEAVLRDIEKHKPDALANLGDQVWGAADPAGAWALQKDFDAVAVRGNTDEMISTQFDSLDERAHAFGSWLRSKLPYEAPSQLADLPTTAELAGGEVVIAHGALTDPLSALLFDFTDSGLSLKSDAALLEQAQSFPNAKVFVVGHTHREVLRSLGGTHFINVGPVSRYLDGYFVARWLLLEKQGSHWDIQFKRVPYDISQAVNWALEQSPFGKEERGMLEPAC